VLGSFDGEGSRGKRLFSKNFPMDRRPTHLPVQCIEHAITLGMKRSGHDVDHLPYEMLRYKKWSYNFLPLNAVIIWTHLLLPMIPSVSINLFFPWSQP